MKTSLAVAAGLAILCAAPAFAIDRCIGPVVNGECMGVVQEDPRFGRPADTYLQDRRGLHTSPDLGPAFDGTQFLNRTHPIIRDGELRWADPHELNK